MRSVGSVGCVGCVLRDNGPVRLSGHDETEQTLTGGNQRVGLLCGCHTFRIGSYISASSRPPPSAAKALASGRMTGVLRFMTIPPLSAGDHYT
jgi:hypothetical protein